MPKYAHSGSVANSTAPGQAIRAERLSLQAQIASLEEQLEYRRRERGDKDERHGAHAGAQELDSRLARLMERYETLEILDVAASRLESVPGREAAIQVVLEIVAAMIGSEEVALYESAAAGEELRLAACCGVQPPERIAFATGLIGQTARTCHEYFAPPPASGHGEANENRISVCIPLLQEGSAPWVLVIYALLPQKQFLEKRDIEILRFLKDHATAALGRKTE
ncbi:MAG TPA: hypothetical protein VLT16_16450 [Candidatus Limnocylindrales bacterium]|nr:hypothetical protein [Candidatus Limnocylindrales bacterium]